MSRMRKALDGEKFYINCVICGKFAVDDICGDCRQALSDPRVLELNILENDAFYGKHLSKLGMRARWLLNEFCQKHRELNHSDFDKAVQRMFLDQEKPKMWQAMMDILVAANNNAKAKGRTNEKSN